METSTTQPQQPPPAVAEKLNQEVVQLLNLYYVKRQAQSLYKSISRILEDLEAYTQTNTTPKWKEILDKYSMVNLDLFILVEEVKEVSKAFVMIPKNVNAENAAILPVMLSSKLLPEMETDDNVKKDQLLQDVQSWPIPRQIESLKERIGKIAEACENAEKVLAETRKAYGLGPRRGPSMFPTMDKGQAAKIQEQESILRAAVNEGAGTRLPPDQRQITTPLPPHLVDVLFDAGKNASSFNINSQGNLMQHQMPYSQPMGHQQFQARQLSGGHIQHGMSQGQLNPPMNRHLNQFSGGGANSASAQGSPRSHASQMFGDQMFNSSGMMQTQQSQSQQQLQQQGGYGNMQTNMLKNAQQGHRNPQ